MVRLSGGTNSGGSISIDSSTIVPSPIQKKREEKGCKSCKKMNDVGVECCWWCGIERPC